MPKITLPDGNQLTLADGATVYDVAAAIGPGLARAAIGGAITFDGNRQLTDLNAPLPGDCRIELLTAKDDNADSLYLLRHSTAHVMAEAICKLYPDTQLAYGPPLEDGFYYDLHTSHAISPPDFERIEAEMQRIVSEDRKFCRYEMPRDEAMKKLEAEGNRFKVDNALRAEGGTLSFYVTGENRGQDWEDLCRGPHIPSTGVIKAFRIKQVSGSYYRGDVNEQQLQRVYGTAFFNKKALKQYEQQLEEAKKRDHRLLGQQLELFTINPDVGSGLVLWEPNGAIVRTMLENYVKMELILRGFEPVFTPHIGRLDLYRTSGHYPYYEDSQFPALYETDRGRALLCLRNLIRRAEEETGERKAEVAQQVKVFADAVAQAFGDFGGGDALDDPAKLSPVVEECLCHEEGYLLKPMNCPHHINIYAAQHRSYRQLPIRLAEFGTVYRYEQSGELGGMVRVRGFTQDDAHIFCTPDQVQAEIASCIELTQQVLSTLEFKDYRARIGLRDPESDKYIGAAELWEQAEQNLRDAAAASGLSATEEIGEAAFYGPKIDFVVKDCIGREWQLGTVQVDYNLPERFKITYVGRDNREHRPVMIHRAPLGSMERFVGILIEHFAGAFPLWLAPVQVAVATISEKSDEYAQEVHKSLVGAGLRVLLDDGSDKIGPKKHRLRSRKIPYILVVGENEAADRTVNVNDRDGASLGTFPLAAFIEGCILEIQTKGKQRHGALQEA
ncbi:MAG: threonine--tRNA ligase [Phycisphaerales bacterium]|nr:threonine--tRNA ligase [Phycisphaerales bacterium]